MNPLGSYRALSELAADPTWAPTLFEEEVYIEVQNAMDAFPDDRQLQIFACGVCGCELTAFVLFSSRGAGPFSGGRRGVRGKFWGLVDPDGAWLR